MLLKFVVNVLFNCLILHWFDLISYCSGRSAKHQPQRVGKDHELMDEDVVQIVKKAG